MINIPNPGHLVPEIKIEGDWVRVENLLDGVGPSVVKGYTKGATRFANVVLQIVKTAIRTGTPPPGAQWPPLSPFTKKRYGDHKIYYLTGTYYKAIGFRKYRNKMVIGLPPRAYRSSSGRLPLSVLARILEFGTRAFNNESIGEEGETRAPMIPPRPLWRPSYSAAGGNQKLSREIIKGIRQSLYQDFRIRANQVRW